MKTSAAPARSTPVIRCAVYTRKSSEEGLDMAFNSLDAQREAGSDYIKSQRHQGWTLVAGQYDDGGYSGGSTERPGLQRLLEDIRRGRIDIVVVYKVDRLSRSLSDFANLMQTFDEHSVSFVSVTQQFNTTTSMGRLTLNMLLSFAQFEREVAGERIRDKIAATKRKGVWVGGQPPLGYRLPRTGDKDFVPGDRVLRIVEPEAKLVQAIYAGYLELGSPLNVAARLNQQGHTTKRWLSSAGNGHGGRPFTAALVYRILTNPIYTGHITHGYRSDAMSRGKDAKVEVRVYPGKHQPIIDRATWDRVRDLMASVEKQTRHRWTHTHLLKGKLRTFENHAMSPGSVQRPLTKRAGSDPKRKRLVRYYVSQKAIKSGFKACPIKTVNAEFVDDLVRGVVLEYLKAQHDADLGQLGPAERDHWIRQVVQTVVLSPDDVVIDIGNDDVGPCVDAVRNAAPKNRAKGDRQATVPTCTLKPEVQSQQGFTRLILPIQFKRHDGKRMIVSPEGKDLLSLISADGQPVPREQLVQAVGLAFAWHRELISTRATVESVAGSFGVTGPWIHALLPLTQLAPAILRSLLSGTAGTNLTLADLRGAAERLDWETQERQLALSP